jgi:ABC-type antimicrobial peptide transport system permease subunit
MLWRLARSLLFLFDPERVHRVAVAALRALGWPRGQVLRVLAVQGLALGLAGGVAGALAVWAAAAVTGAAPGASGLAAVTAAGAALLATALAVAGPLAHALGARPADVLRGE